MNAILDWYAPLFKAGWYGRGSPIVKALKKLQHEIMFYDAEIVAQEQAEREVILEMKKEKN